MVEVYLHFYLRHNYMFLLFTIAIFRLYMNPLESSYTRFNMGCVQWGCGG